MRMILMSALFAAGVGLAGTTGASAAPITGAGVLDAVSGTSLTEDVQYRRYRRNRDCRTVRVCSRGPYGRRFCRLRTVCYR